MFHDSEMDSVIMDNLSYIHEPRHCRRIRVCRRWRIELACWCDLRELEFRLGMEVIAGGELQAGVLSVDSRHLFM